jgi:glycosyltransferase involved in cell wall biosynthesis
MRLGIDAKWLHRGPPSGKRVVRNLVQAISRIAPDVELHLFLDERGRDEPLPPCIADAVPEARRHWVWAGVNQLSNIFVLPRVADRAMLDAVVYQSFVPPPRLARHARIAFVHDAIFASDPSYFTWRERLYFTPLRWLASTADRVCTVSECERERLIDYDFATPGRIDVVPNGVESPVAGTAASAADLCARLGVTGRFVLYVGRLNVRKNVGALVRAMAEVRTPGISLVVAGAPDRTTEDLAGIAQAAGIASRVRFLGHVDDEIVQALYARATAFCFPSFDEGFGLSPLEAMAAGVPTIVSRVPALLETCGDGARYADGDALSIAAAIDAVAGNARASAALRASGLQRASGFTWERAARRLLASVHAAVRDAAVPATTAYAPIERRT